METSEHIEPSNGQAASDFVGIANQGQWNDTGIIPLGDRALIRRLPEEEQTKGGIAVPEAHREQPVEGIVLAVGPGRDLESGYILPLRVQPGMRVVFGRYAGVDLPKSLGENLLFVRGDEILAVRKA